MRTPEGTTIWYLRVIHHIAQDSDVWTLDISGEEWGEVDFPEDVEGAQALVDELGRSARAPQPLSKAACPSPLGLFVKISQPVSVMPIECSNWADSERSRVTAVQPSSSSFTSARPMLIIGSTVKNMPGRSSGPVPGRPAWTTSGESWNSRPRPWPQKSRTTL